MRLGRIRLHPQALAFERTDSSEGAALGWTRRSLWRLPLDIETVWRRLPPSLRRWSTRGAPWDTFFAPLVAVEPFLSFASAQAFPMIEPSFRNSCRFRSGRQHEMGTR
jgi:hypothetical protein